MSQKRSKYKKGPKILGPKKARNNQMFTLFVLRRKKIAPVLNREIGQFSNVENLAFFGSLGVILCLEMVVLSKKGIRCIRNSTQNKKTQNC